MKGKNPTLKQKQAIKAAGEDSANWLVTKAPPGRLFLVHRQTGAEKVIAV